MATRNSTGTDYIDLQDNISKRLKQVIGICELASAYPAGSKDVDAERFANAMWAATNLLEEVSPLVDRLGNLAAEKTEARHG